MTFRSPRARLLGGAAVSLALTFLLAPLATATPVARGVALIGSAADRARPTTDPSISRPLALLAAADAALRTDPGLAAIARRRATDMRDRGYFGHVSPDGRTVFDMLDAARVAWASGTEVIGWNDLSTPDGSAGRVVADWLASPSHRVDLLSRESDRIGLASVLDAATGRRTWAAVLVETADRTAPVAAMRVVAIGRRDTSGRRLVTVAWTTRDDPGSGIASGVRDVTVQVRIGAGPWRTAQRGAGGSVRLRASADRAVAFRVRPRDRAGNMGAWATVTVRP
jgi:hypothetical protein